MTSKLSTSIKENRQQLDLVLNLNDNFDILTREFDIGSQKCCLYFVDGCAQNDVITNIMRHFLGYKVIKADETFDTAIFEAIVLPFAEVDMTDDFDKVVHHIMTGSPILLIDKLSTAYAVQAKDYPQRIVAEPEKDKVVRGAHDGFVEIPVFNATLIRRRIKHPDLILKAVLAGNTDVIVCYMKGKCDRKLVQRIIEKLQTMDVGSITMNQETIVEHLFPPKWHNPLPIVRYSERPDITSAAILEGKLVLLVDNSPAAMILPANFFDLLMDANDYYFPPLIATFYRSVRLFTILVSLVLTPLWLVCLQNGDKLPYWLKFVLIEEPTSTPIVFQLLIMELIMEIMRISTINTPATLGTAFSIVGSLLVGEFAVSAGWLSYDAVFYTAFLSVAMYAQPNTELGYTILIHRVILILLTSIFGWVGFVAGLIMIVIIAALTKTADHKPYLYPLIPLNIRRLGDVLVRGRLER
ncbi:MAG: spore germination protein [Eubacteriales bacterium]|nr:spore germination protein [Eubacteriales bacterium]